MVKDRIEVEVVDKVVDVTEELAALDNEAAEPQALASVVVVVQEA